MLNQKTSTKQGGHRLLGTLEKGKGALKRFKKREDEVTKKGLCG